MVRRLQSVVLRVAIAFTMAISLMLAPAGGSSSHDPVALAQAETERHQALADEIADHGHSHDDGWSGESEPGHLHGHNAADHLHDTPSDPPSMTSLHVQVGDLWRISAISGFLPLRVFELDRPPRA